MAAKSSTRTRYRFGDDDWKVERMDLLAVVFPEMTPEQLPAFHAAVASDGRAWLFVRRLWGIMPLVPPADWNYDDFRVWSASELKVALGMDAKAHRAELDRVAGIWLSRGRADGTACKEQAVAAAEKSALFNGELALPEPVDDDAELRKAGFSPSMFAVEGRPPADGTEEKKRFLLRLRKVAKALAQDSLTSTVRSLLLVQLDLERLEAMYYALSQGDGRRKALGEERLKLQKEEREINDQLCELAPWFFQASATGVSMTSAFTMLVEGMQRLKSEGDATLLRGVGAVTGILVDGLHDAEEIAGQLRMSQEGLRSGQAPQYDPGWVAYVNMTRDRFWDPRYAPLFEKKTLARLRRVFAADWSTACSEEGVHIPELSAEGPDGEYRDALAT